MDWVKDDGGRTAAGFKGLTGDCVTRSIAIATGVSYREVYDTLKKMSGSSPRNGMNRKFYDRYLNSLGWQWHATMKIGTGCKVHLDPKELPAGPIICRISKHMCAVIDGVLHDTWNCAASGVVELDQNMNPLPGSGRRCVYGYWMAPA